MLACPIPFLIACSFHPPCGLVSNEGWIFLPSSAVGFVLSWWLCHGSSELELIIGVCSNPLSVSVSREVGCGSPVKMDGNRVKMCSMSIINSVHQENENPSLYISTVCKSEACNNTPSKRTPMVKENGTIRNANVSMSICCWAVLSIVFLFLLTDWLG